MLAPITVKAATAWVRDTHRHLPSLQGGLFAVAVREGHADEAADYCFALRAIDKALSRPTPERSLETSDYMSNEMAALGGTIAAMHTKWMQRTELMQKDGGLALIEHMADLMDGIVDAVPELQRLYWAAANTPALRTDTPETSTIRNAALEEADETGWLVEVPFGPDIHYLGLCDPHEKWAENRKNDPGWEPYGRHALASMITFNKDANDALRFARKEDAEQFVTAFATLLTSPKIAEHMWPAIRKLASTVSEQGDEG